MAEGEKKKSGTQRRKGAKKPRLTPAAIQAAVKEVVEKGGKGREKKGPAGRKVGKSPTQAASEHGRKARAAQAGQGNGGRKPGTPNKRTLVLYEMLVAKGLDENTHPVSMMYDIYTGAMTMPVVVRLYDAQTGKPYNVKEEVPLEPRTRVDCMKEVAQYLEPKRKAIELSGEVEVTGIALQDSALSAPWLNSEKGSAWANSADGIAYLAERSLMPIKRKQQEGGA